MKQLPLFLLLFSAASGAATLNGVVARESHYDPLGDAYVRLRMIGSTESKWTRSGQDGSFRFDHLAPGGYEVRALLSNYQPKSTTVTIAGQDQTLTETMLLRSGRITCYGPELYSPMATLTVAVDGVPRITGVVRDGRHPASRVRVRLEPMDGSRPAMAVTNARGGFSFSSLAPGDYRIEFDDLKHIPGWAEAEVKLGKQSTLEIKLIRIPPIDPKNLTICQ